MYHLHISPMLERYVEASKPELITFGLSDLEPLLDRQFFLDDTPYYFKHVENNLNFLQAGERNRLLTVQTLPVFIPWRPIYHLDKVVIYPYFPCITKAVGDIVSRVLAKTELRFRFIELLQPEPLFLWEYEENSVICYSSEKENFAIPLILELGKTEEIRL